MKEANSDTEGRSINCWMEEPQQSILRKQFEL